MCIRDRESTHETADDPCCSRRRLWPFARTVPTSTGRPVPCLLYTSDAADERSSVDLGGRRIIKKKKIVRHQGEEQLHTKTRTKAEEHKSKKVNEVKRNQQ